MNTVGAKKCIRILRNVIYVLLTNLNFAQKMVALNKGMLVSTCDRQGSHRYKLSLTILIQISSFLKCEYVFWHPLYIHDWAVKLEQMNYSSCEIMEVRGELKENQH